MKERLPDAGFYFAMKSNNLPHISKVLLKQGFGLDVSSGAELSTALDLGARQIIFSGPGKTRAELRLAAENHDTVIVLLDSRGELSRLAAIAAAKNKRIRVGLRLNHNPEGLWRKFGILLEELESLYLQIKGSSHLEFSGLQFHSSWNLDPLRQAEFIKTLGGHLKKMPDQFINDLEFIDIGGGYWPSQGEWLVSEDPLSHKMLEADPIESFAQLLAQALESHVFPLKHCRIFFEPGRWICNDAMHLLIQVVDCKNEDLVITDAGTNAIGWERFETDYFPVINLSQPLTEEKSCHIMGSLCTPHDVWGYAYYGKGITEGDILMIPTQGAYTYSLRQTFIKPLPWTVVIDPSGSPLAWDNFKEEAMTDDFCLSCGVLLSPQVFQCPVCGFSNCFDADGDIVLDDRLIAVLDDELSQENHHQE